MVKKQACFASWLYGEISNLISKFCPWKGWNGFPLFKVQLSRSLVEKYSGNRPVALCGSYLTDLEVESNLS